MGMPSTVGEAEIIENHSGVVDCFRNLKGDPDLIARYNRPVRVAVKVRQQIVQTPARVLVDFFVLNENDLRGPHTVEVRASAPGRRRGFHAAVSGGPEGAATFSVNSPPRRCLIPIEGAPGMYEIDARLLDGAGVARADGRDEGVRGGLEVRKARRARRGVRKRRPRARISPVAKGLWTCPHSSDDSAAAGLDRGCARARGWSRCRWRVKPCRPRRDSRA